MPHLSFVWRLGLICLVLTTLLCAAVPTTILPAVNDTAESRHAIHKRADNPPFSPGWTGPVPSYNPQTDFRRLIELGSQYISLILMEPTEAEDALRKQAGTYGLILPRDADSNWNTISGVWTKTDMTPVAIEYFLNPMAQVIGDTCNEAGDIYVEEGKWQKIGDNKWKLGFWGFKHTQKRPRAAFTPVSYRHLINTVEGAIVRGTVNGPDTIHDRMERDGHNFNSRMSTVAAITWIGNTLRASHAKVFDRRKNLRWIIDPYIELGDGADHPALNLMVSLGVGPQVWPMVNVFAANSWQFYALLGLDRSEWIAELLYMHKGKLGHRLIYSVSAYRNQHDRGYGLLWSIGPAEGEAGNLVSEDTKKRMPRPIEGKLWHPWETPPPGQANFPPETDAMEGLQLDPAASSQNDPQQGSSSVGKQGQASGLQPSPLYDSQTGQAYSPQGAHGSQDVTMGGWGDYQASSAAPGSSQGNRPPGNIEVGERAFSRNSPPPNEWWLPYGSPQLNSLLPAPQPAPDAQNQAAAGSSRAANHGDAVTAREARNLRIARALERYRQRFPDQPRA